MQSYGYLCSNYTARGVLCIELKPKWLVPLPDSKKKETFSSSSQWTMNSSSSIRSTPSTCVCECRFCLHQALKLKLKLKLNSSALIHDECSTTTTTTTTFISPSLTSTTSSCEWQWTSFCPLDLLQVSTLPKAVQGLLRSPNNNLRLFEQGHPVPLVKYPHYQHLVTQALKEVHPLLQELSMHQSQLDQLATMTLPSFSATCIHPHEKNLPCVQCLPDLMTLHEWHGFVTWYLQKQPTFSFSTSTSTSTSSITWMPSIFLFAYLLSKTLKDCSILVTVSTLDPFQVLDCVIIDVDLKPMHKLPTWLALDAELEKKDENKAHSTQH
ncbi:hypothetical protein HMI56_004127 [Coelomomyces lativittatus]|nr:hypothetical protein HMI56_004127 [Coelomomyces lativittatus]